jgi:hypothetical protein
MPLPALTAVDIASALNGVPDFWHRQCVCLIDLFNSAIPWVRHIAISLLIVPDAWIEICVDNIRCEVGKHHADRQHEQPHLHHQVVALNHRIDHEFAHPWQCKYRFRDHGAPIRVPNCKLAMVTTA